MIRKLTRSSSVTVAVLVALPLWCQTARTHRESPSAPSSRFSLGIAAPATIKVGGTLSVTAIVTNRSHLPQTIFESGSDYDHDVLVVDATGKELRLTAIGKRLAEDGRTSWGSRRIELAPGGKR